MNKRARLARRILRDHRPGDIQCHWTWGPYGYEGAKSVLVWQCPHCEPRWKSKAHVPTYYGGGREQTRTAG